MAATEALIKGFLEFERSRGIEGSFIVEYFDKAEEAEPARIFVIMFSRWLVATGQIREQP